MPGPAGWPTLGRFLIASPALAPHADHPFTMQERKNLKGIVAAYEASRK